jgi:hypothetical protein
MQQGATHKHNVYQRKTITESLQKQCIDRIDHLSEYYIDLSIVQHCIGVVSMSGQ